jgi:hypothetical protein
VARVDLSDRRHAGGADHPGTGRRAWRERRAEAALAWSVKPVGDGDPTSFVASMGAASRSRGCAGANRFGGIGHLVQTEAR